MTFKRTLRLIITLMLSLLFAVSCSDSSDNNTKTVQKIELVSGTVSTEVNAGSALNTSNIKVTVTYNDNTTEQVGVDKLTVGRIDTGVIGTHELMVSYGSFTLYVPITVVSTEAPSEPSVTAVSDVTGIATSLDVGASFNASAIKATVSYSDGTSKEIGVSDGLVIGGDTVNTSKGGTYYLVVSYKGVFATPVAVNVNSKIIGIELDADSFDTVLYHNDTVDVSTIRFFEVYDDGERVLITDKTALTVDTAAITTATLGERSFGARYNIGQSSFTATVPYSVLKKLTSLDIVDTSLATKTTLGGVIDTAGIIVNAIYSDGSTAPLGYSDLQINAPDTATAGDKTLTVSYGGVSGSITVCVSPKLYGIAYSGGKLDFKHTAGTQNDPEVATERFEKYVEDGFITLILTYDNGGGVYTTESKTVSSADTLDYDGLDSSSITELSYISISYGGFEAEIEYRVTKYIASLSVSDNSTFNNRIAHNADASKSVSGIALTVTYSDGTTAEISRDALDIDGFDTARVAASAQMTLSYSDAFGEASLVIPYEIYKTFVSLTFNDSEYTTVYKPGQPIDAATTVGAKIVYSDGSFENVEATLDEFDLDTSVTSGLTKTITFSYTDGGEVHTGELNVEVLKIKALTVIGADTHVPYWHESGAYAENYVDTLINLSALEVAVTFVNQDGEEFHETLKNDELTVSHAINIRERGSYKVEAKTENYGTATVDITVGYELEAISINNSTSIYFQNGLISLGTLIIEATYHDGYTELLEYSKIKSQISHAGFDTSELGDHTYTITYTANGVSASATDSYTVHEAYDEATTSFKFNVADLTILHGEEFNFMDYGEFVVNGVDVSADEDFTYDCLYNSESPRVGIYTVTVSYKGLTVTMTLRVLVSIVPGNGNNVTDKTA